MKRSGIAPHGPPRPLVSVPPDEGSSNDNAADPRKIERLRALPTKRSRPDLPKERQHLSTQVSLLLATVIAGAAIREALVTYAAQKAPKELFDWALLPGCIAVVVTTLRFYHGNVMWTYCNLESTSQDGLTVTQRVFNRLSSYYIHIFQYILFYMAGATLDNRWAVVQWMCLLSAVDVFWSGVGYMFEKQAALGRTLGVWALLNILTASGAGCILWAHKGASTISDTGMGVFSVMYVLAAVADYLLNPDVFFGSPDKLAEKPIRLQRMANG